MFGTGALLGSRYRLGPLIGRGGMADVHRADDVVTGRPVAVKFLRALHADHLRRFASEADTLSRLEHPSLVRLLDRGEHEGVPYLVLELVDGEPLSHVLARGPLPVERVVELAAVLAAGLAHAHSFGIVHRDVKPGNVLIDQAGHPLLADFGIARFQDATSVTATGAMVGTACYLAPEQVTGTPAGPPADIYALALVLVESLTGERTFPGTPLESSMARLHADPPVPPGLPPALASTLAAMTARQPEERPAALDVVERLTGRRAEPLWAPVPVVPPGAGPATTVMASGSTGVLPVSAGRRRVALAAWAGLAGVGRRRAAGAHAAAHAMRPRGLAVVAGAVAAVVAAGLFLGSLDGRAGLQPAEAGTPGTSTSVPAPTTSTTASTSTTTTTVPVAEDDRGRGRERDRQRGDEGDDD
ncbi:MAG: serine/threonine-protein kinase [Acidimicrobiia bacterium]